MPAEIHRTRLFTGCVVSLVATAFGFAVRAAILEDWRTEFNLSGEQIGYLLGAGLFPFAISIILFSLVIDRLGNGRSMAVAFALHVSSAVITLAAPLALAAPGASPEEVLAGQRAGFALLYLGTFVFALGNGTVEAVINPVTATLYDREKTKYLNILHAGWPGGLVLGGLLAIAVSFVDPGRVPGSLWQWQMGLVLVPTILYGAMLFGQRFPVQERVAANVSYYEMLQEFGAASCFIVLFFVVSAMNQILVIFGVPTFSLVSQLGMSLIPTLLFAFYVKSFGRPMFVLLLLVMVLLATTELGTDSWIADIMRTVLQSPTLGTMFLVWTSLIMFVMRFFAGPIVHRITPLGLLAASAGVAAVGLLWLANAGTSAAMLFIAATFYGFGKTFLWPTTLGVVSEQYPRGGALMLNAIAGVGMISVGTIGNPAIGAVLDNAQAAAVREADPALAKRLLVTRPGLFGQSEAVDPAHRALLAEQLAAATARAQDTVPPEIPAAGGPTGGAEAQITTAAGRGELERQTALLAEIDARTKQATLAKIAILPTIMLVCYLGLIAYFRSIGGYRQSVLLPEPPGTVARH
jgi:MFS family permease